MATNCTMAILWQLKLSSEVAAPSDDRVLASSLGVTTPSVAMSSEQTAPGGASLVGDDEEGGLVLGQLPLSSGMRTPPKRTSSEPEVTTSSRVVLDSVVLDNVAIRTRRACPRGAYSAGPCGTETVRDSRLLPRGSPEVADVVIGEDGPERCRAPRDDVPKRAPETSIRCVAWSSSAKMTQWLTWKHLSALRQFGGGWHRSRQR